MYVINFLPLFANSWQDISGEFKHLHVNDLYQRLSKKQIRELFDINSYRAHLNMSNKMLKRAITKKQWGKSVVFINFNKHIYDGNNMTYKKEYYLPPKKRKGNISITLDFHINKNSYFKNIQKCRIPELNKILRKC